MKILFSVPRIWHPSFFGSWKLIQMRPEPQALRSENVKFLL